MDDLGEQIALLESSANLSTSITDVQKAIDMVAAARAAIAADPTTAPITLARLQDPFKKTLDAAQKDLKPIYAGLGRYGKTLDRKFKDKPLPSAENDALSSHPSLINRAIAMHLLREGQFGVASTFLHETNRRPPNAPTTSNSEANDAWGQELAQGTFSSEKLQQQFADMYHILHQLRVEQNLEPAIQWARQRSDLLEARGSNLEFDLCRLQFVSLFVGSGQNHEQHFDDPPNGPLLAWDYARREFGPFQKRYARDIQSLMGALAYWQNIEDSPYCHFFYNESAWDDVAHSFNREFCSLLGLSADSPLFITATAGAIALPYLLKMQSIMKEKRTEWTTQNELPVEIPLPSQYHFHSIFVCPVSKEQTTDENPPMMIPCGHVIAKESLDKLSKGVRFKCPYCPSESHPRDARKVVL